VKQKDEKPRPYAPNSTLRLPARPMRKMSKKRERDRRMGTAAKYGDHHVYVRDGFNCVLVDHPKHRCWTPSDARYPIDSHHVDPQGGDAANCVPCCRAAHSMFHDVYACDNERILADWNIDLEAIAADLWARAGRPA
jgi:hypothetical protein